LFEKLIRYRRAPLWEAELEPIDRSWLPHAFEVHIPLTKSIGHQGHFVNGLLCWQIHCTYGNTGKRAKPENNYLRDNPYQKIRCGIFAPPIGGLHVKAWWKRARADSAHAIKLRELSRGTRETSNPRDLAMTSNPLQHSGLAILGYSVPVRPRFS
jgi:hypothetical protein